MADKIGKHMASAAWLFYLIIVFEILYMISPLAIYFYSSYGPALNFLHNTPTTAWLTQFYLPHFTETDVFLLNIFPSLAWLSFLSGLILFLIAAGQVYHAKFTRKGAIENGLYKYMRNPQYTAFALMGFGTALIWPRFIVLIMFISMLFVYYWLAKKEEKECIAKFGEDFRKYVRRTPMFIPRWMFTRQSHFRGRSKHGQLLVGALTFGLAVSLPVLLAFAMRNYAVKHIALLTSQDSATVSTAHITNEKMQEVLDIALASPEVMSRLRSAGYADGQAFLNYIVPMEWILADLPLEPIPEGAHGHDTPADYDGRQFKVLFTAAGFASDEKVVAEDILKKAIRRQPVVVARISLDSGLLAVEVPPPHVLWGDIPTPMF